MRSLRKLLYTTLLMGTLFVGVSCEDLAFGDKFLQKPPSSDVTIDTIFSTSEYARRILWKELSISSLWNGNFRLLDANVVGDS